MNCLVIFRVLSLLLLVYPSQANAHGDEEHKHDDSRPASAVANPADAAASSRRLSDGSLFIAKPMQRRLGLRTLLASMEAHATTLTFNGAVIADPNASGRVQAIQSGRVAAGPKGLPSLGQRVRKGEVLAWLQPAASSLERGGQQAALAELEAQAAIAERRVRRLDQLEGAVPQKEIEAARIELTALNKRRAAIGASLAAPEPLRAPVAGVISAAHVVAGQVVEAREVLFEVVDPARLAIEALAYEVLPGTLTEASAQTAGGNLALRFIGAGRQLREQALPLHFRIESSDGAARLAVGQLVKVIAKTPGKTDGIVLPATALTRNAAGETVVWLHTEAERFMPRVVKAAALDARNVAIGASLRAGDRVVVEGAAQLARMR